MEKWFSSSTMGILRAELTSPDLATRGLSQPSHLARPFVIFKRTILNSGKSIRLSTNIHGQSLLLTFTSNLKIVCGVSTWAAQSLWLRAANSGDGGCCAWCVG